MKRGLMLIEKILLHEMTTLVNVQINEFIAKYWFLFTELYRRIYKLSFFKAI
jgi:hypothetical protein